MDRIYKLFGLAIVVLQLHLAEQLLFGIDELYELQGAYAKYASLFDNADVAAVVAVGLVTTLVMLACYALMIGGRPALVVIACFGLEFNFELHHVIKALATGEYFPGAVTAVAMWIIGNLLLKQAWRVRNQYRSQFTRLSAAAGLL